MSTQYLISVIESEPQVINFNKSKTFTSFVLDKEMIRSNTRKSISEKISPSKFKIDELLRRDNKTQETEEAITDSIKKQKTFEEMMEDPSIKRLLGDL